MLLNNSQPYFYEIKIIRGEYSNYVPIPNFKRNHSYYNNGLYMKNITSISIDNMTTNIQVHRLQIIITVGILLYNKTFF